MSNTRRVAREVGTDGVFNRDTPAKGPRPTARGKERIQRGKEFMPEWTIAQMDERRKGLKDGKEKTVLLACIKRKESKTIAKTAKEMRRKPGTVRGWLARGRDRGLYDLADHTPPGRVPILDQAKVETIRGWLSCSPADFGYKRNRWQCGTVRERIRDKLNVSCSPDTVRRAICRVGFSYRKSRPAPRKSASEEEQKGFKEKTGALLARLAVLGSVILALDEASCLVGGWNGYGWLPVGGRETSPMSWSKKAVRMIGVLGDGWFHIALVDSANSDTLIKFLDKVRESVGDARDLAVVMDNVSYHKSRKMKGYENGLKGKLTRVFLPKYTPQLNPIEMLWRDLKHALAGGYFDSIDELKAAITEIVNAGELSPPKLMDYMLPDGAEADGAEAARIPCKIWDMTSKAKPAEAAAA